MSWIYWVSFTQQWRSFNTIGPPISCWRPLYAYTGPSPPPAKSVTRLFTQTTGRASAVFSLKGSIVHFFVALIFIYSIPFEYLVTNWADDLPWTHVERVQYWRTGAEGIHCGESKTDSKSNCLCCGAIYLASFVIRLSRMAVTNQRSYKSDNTSSSRACTALYVYKESCHTARQLNRATSSPAMGAPLGSLGSNRRYLYLFRQRPQP